MNFQNFDPEKLTEHTNKIIEFYKTAAEKAIIVIIVIPEDNMKVMGWVVDDNESLIGIANCWFDQKSTTVSEAKKALELIYGSCALLSLEEAEKEDNLLDLDLGAFIPESIVLTTKTEMVLKLRKKLNSATLEFSKKCLEDFFEI